jgi:hypothetical protein
MAYKSKGILARRWRLIGDAVLMLVLSGAFLAGCAHPAQAHRSSARPSPEQPSQADPSRAVTQDLCSRFTAIALASDATIDRGPADARRRAAQQLGTPALLEQFAGEGRDHAWPSLSEHQAHVQVTTSPVADDPPTLRASQAAAGVIAHRLAIGPNGWHQPLPSTVAYCSLIQDDGGWHISKVTFADLDTTADPS